LRTELKLHLLKKAVNLCMRLIDRFLPETRPRYPQSVMLEHVFQQLFNAYLLEMYSGRFDDVSRQSLVSLKDRNFQHFLSVARKILLFIGENDRYYRAWIGLAFIAGKEEYEQALRDLTREEFLRSHLEQWELAFHCIPESHFQLHKSDFLDMMLTGHLSNLLRKRFASSKSPQSKKKVGG